MAKIQFIKEALKDYFPDSATVGIEEDMSFISWDSKIEGV